MRFDDSLKTVLSAERRPGNGAEAAWRQIVDLVGRGRAPADDETVARLAELRTVVPAEVRAGSARALAFATPPRALVIFFAADELAIAAPVLRTARLAAGDWRDVLTLLGPAQRSVLRQRRDLPDDTVRALESFGAVDFRIESEAAVEQPPAPVSLPEPAPIVSLPPVVVPPVAAPAPQFDEATPRFEIADLVARIDRFTRDRPAPALPAATPASGLRFETDARGVVTMVEGPARGVFLGVTLADDAAQGLVRFDAGVGGAWRRRDAIRDARMEIGGTGEAAGAWRVSAKPAFDALTGRFTGYRGEARRPRADEALAAAPAPASTASEQLRQLVHELRTPANAIAGFSELIGSQLLGPVAEPYLGRARTIHARAGALIDAIDDLDIAARIDGGALELRDEVVAIGPLLDRLAFDLGPLGVTRGARLAIAPVGGAAVRGDARAVERLLSRLLAAVLGTSGRGEAIGIDVRAGREQVAVTVDRPAALAAIDGDALFSIDNDQMGEGTPLLGTGFALRLVRNLAAELGGVLAIGPVRLTLRLPAASDRTVEQARIS